MAVYALSGMLASLAGVLIFGFLGNILQLWLRSATIGLGRRRKVPIAPARQPSE